jgi:hypothetical protein
MAHTQKNTGASKWLAVIAATGLLVSFFLPWVAWQGILIKGYDMPAGNFFRVSATEFGLDNPLPQLNFAFYVFWLIPAGALASIGFITTNKKGGLLPFITGALSLSLVAVYFLFTQKLIMLGVGENVFNMLRPAAWIHAISAVGLIISTPASYPLLKKTIWIVAGPVFVFISFLLMEKYLMNKTHDNTDNIKAEYEVTAPQLIREFAINDSAANRKYREKIVSVSGITSQVELKGDSTVNIKFIDTTNHYIIFSLDKSFFERAKSITAGQPVSLKGSCSGSSYSQILDSTSIDFKRATLNKQ